MIRSLYVLTSLRCLDATIAYNTVQIISPGSQTTLAQLGLPESFTPARYRLRSRMFAGENAGEYEAVKIRRKEKAQSAPNGIQNGTTNGESHHEEEPEWEEDRVSEEGAIWPIQEGRIVDWPAFYALMEHVYNTVNPPFHTPILLISEPVWTLKEHEKVTQFFFEKFKVPAFGMMDSAMATTYAYGVQTATVVDIGMGKADITCVTDFVLHNVGRGLAVPKCGGEAMTERLVELLSGRKGFNRDVCEQLKKSNICEILPSDVDMPGEEPTTGDGVANPAAAASTGADGAAPGQRKQSVVDLPRGPGPGTEVGEEKRLEDEEGVLDIASIVTGGNMGEYLAQKEKEKADKAAARQQKKASDAQQVPARPVRLANAKRTRNTFIYEDIALHDAMKKAGMSSGNMADMQSALQEGPNKRQKTPEPQSAVSDKPAEPTFEAATEKSPSTGIRREIEVGPERFQAATGGILERLADSIYRTVQSCGDINKRSDLWDSLIVIGNGSKVRGFKEALLEMLNKKYIIFPSSATIFTSELPSNFSTPVATGANTPQPQLPGQAPPHHGVNPLLLAATTAQHQQHLHPPPSSVLGQPHSSHQAHSSHGQTPTSIKYAKIPEYFPEWKEVGYDEASFLGAQVAAKVLFIVDGGVSNGYMTRTSYNEQGPSGIHECMM